MNHSATTARYHSSPNLRPLERQLVLEPSFSGNRAVKKPLVRSVKPSDLASLPSFVSMLPGTELEPALAVETQA